MQVPTIRMTCLLKSSDHRKSINQYGRRERIGKGKHGEVFLCTDHENLDRQVAMKVVRRTNPRDKMKLLRKSHQGCIQPLSTTEHGIRKEVAIMKKCHHSNLVRLFEVIDDPHKDKIYLSEYRSMIRLYVAQANFSCDNCKRSFPATVMEYLPGGPVEWTNAEHEPILLLEQTRRIIRDVIVGLDYLHHQGIIHRDIKPANLLWTEDRTTVKIIDFGVSHLILNPRVSPQLRKITDEDAELFPEADLRRTIGTPSFLAPEVVWFDESPETAGSGTLSPSQEAVGGTFSRKPPITQAIDVWSLAVTFYCFLFGHTPFNVENEGVHHKEYTLYHQICTQDWAVHETMGVESVKTGGRHPKDRKSEGSIVINLLDQMLLKDPTQRITIGDLKRHPWFLHNTADPDEWLRVTLPGLPPVPEIIPLLRRWARRAGQKLFGALR